MSRAAKLNRVQAITFDSNMETLTAGAAAVVSMGGYNTFCEVLSLDKRTLIVPRTVPRLEQLVRATRAAKLGLISMLPEDEHLDPAVMAAAIRALPRQKLPSEVVIPGLLEGLPNVARLVAPWITDSKLEQQTLQALKK
jgi:predicted glycosyltransferase